MAVDSSDAIADILGRWREDAERGRPLDPEALLAAHPELAPELRQALRAQGLLDDAFAVWGAAYRAFETEEIRWLLLLDRLVDVGDVSPEHAARALLDAPECGGDVGKALHEVAEVTEASLDEAEAHVARLIAHHDGDPRLALAAQGGPRPELRAALRRGRERRGRPQRTLGGARSPDHPGPPDLPGGRYANLQLEDRGGMGWVFSAVDTELDRVVALKMIRHESGAQADPDASGEAPDVRSSGADSTEAFDRLKTRFLQEAIIAGGLEHPGVVPVYDLGQTACGEPYYTMRFFRGQRTLDRALEELDGAPVEERLSLLESFLKLCDTVSYAHSEQVVHRDLKPRNVALGEFGEVVVLDWGLARYRGRPDLVAKRWQERAQLLREEAGFRTLAGLGTPGYMAPEAVDGDLGAIDEQSDVYSLGAVLYEILTGRPPHEFETLDEFLREVEKPPRPPHAVDAVVPVELSDACMRALAPEKRSRFGTVAELSSAVRAWQARSAADREVEGLLRDADTALRAAEQTRGVVRLQHVDRAAAALEQVGAQRPDAPGAPSLKGRVAALRGVAVEERAGQRVRRLLVRGGLLLLAAAAVVAVLVANALDRRARAAQAERDQVLRLSDVKTVDDLIREVETLWPVRSDRAAAMGDWLERARRLVGRREVHEDALREIRARALPSEPAGQSAEGVWRFEASEDAWRHQVLADLLERLGRVQARLIPELEARYGVADKLRTRTIDDRASQWVQVRERVQASARYRGLDLPPQEGLVPLGPDPVSGLEEFAHVTSGTLPTRDAESGQLLYDDDAAIVLVLLPGGTFPMGSQADDPQGPNYYALAAFDEAPVRAVTLPPFFMAKHECTQAQWEAITGGERPSGYKEGMSGPDGLVITRRNPVEQISRHDAQRWLGRFGLRVPTEPEWEYACRAGTDSAWVSGNDVEGLSAFANIADSHLKAGGGQPDWGYTLEVDDGHSVHAPVGTYAANAYGLFDVAGNVWEWTADEFAAYPGRSSKGLVVPEGDLGVVRGGGWFRPAGDARSAYRGATGPGTVSDYLGVRPARTLSR